MSFPFLQGKVLKFGKTEISGFVFDDNILIISFLKEKIL